jgi:hypothetical protein
VLISGWLMPESKLLDQRAVGVEVGVSEVRQEPTPGPYHLEQAATPVMVLGMDPEMVGERIDSLGEQRHLEPGRAGVFLVEAILRCDALLVVRHALWSSSHPSE